MSQTIAAAPKSRSQPAVVAVALGLVVALAALAKNAAGPRIGIAALIGFAGGLALYHASFGFTGAWRRLLLHGRSLGARAQIVMLAMSATVFYPLLARGSLFGEALSGFVNPVGVAVCVGAFLFGVGMQLGGGCGSGTLFNAGGGDVRLMATLASFVAGSVIATADPLGWMEWPNVGAYSLIEISGVWSALTIALSILALAYWGLWRLERKLCGDAQPLWTSRPADLLRGPWPTIAGALALAAVNVATLVDLGRPWGITSGYALWGAKIVAALGVDVAAWPYWRGDPSLGASLFADATSVMNFGIILGALAAAGLAERFAPNPRVGALPLAAAVLGGLAMGIGARLSTGCNIGAFFSGFASASLHSIVWLAFALPGNLVGVRLRPVFSMANP